jgi:hypothetical protein
MTWRHHIERAAAKALRTYVRIYSLIKIGRLSTNIKLALYKAMIRSLMTYACPTCVYATDAHLLKLQRLQSRVLHAVGDLDGCTRVAIKISYVYEYIIKLCRTQAEVILNHINPNVRGNGQGEARHVKYKRLKLGGGQTYDRSAD